MSEFAIQVKGLGKRYRIGTRERYKTLRDTIVETVAGPVRAFGSLVRKRSTEASAQASNLFWALKDVSFDVPRGTVLGVVGRNGAGKSTLLKTVSGITEPTEGRVEIHGRVGSLLEVGTGFHPELTGRENIFLNGAILGMRRAEITAKFDEIVAFAEVPQFIDTPVKHYSSGMYMRLAFAVAAHLEPEILLIDEVLAVGDAEFQRKCLGKMDQVARQGRTVIFVSHNFIAVENLCPQALLLDRGRLVMIGETRDVLAKYLGSKDEQRDLATAGNRHGSGEIQFVNCTISVRDKHRDMTIRSGDDITIRLHYRCATPVVKPSFSVAFRTPVGTPVFAVRTFDVGAIVPRISADGYIDLDLFKVNLMPGTYSVDMAVGDQLDPHRYDLLLGAAELQIEASDIYGTGRLSGANWTLVYFDCRWRVGDHVENVVAERAG